MTPKYKLKYFNFRGLAEPIRYLFKYGNIDFEDNRIELEDWPKLRSSTPFGVMPLLEVDGAIYGESIAIARYVGHIVGLGGKTNLEDLKIDSIVDSHVDLMRKIISAYWEQDQEKRKELLEAAKNEHLEFYFTKFEEIVKKNGYLALDRLTWADVLLAGHFPLINVFLDIDVGAKYPNLNALVKKIENFPEIKKWIEIRPDTIR